MTMAASAIRSSPVLRVIMRQKRGSEATEAVFLPCKAFFFSYDDSGMGTESPIVLYLFIQDRATNNEDYQ